MKNKKGESAVASCLFIEREVGCRVDAIRFEGLDASDPLSTPVLEAIQFADGTRLTQADGAHTLVDENPRRHPCAAHYAERRWRKPPWILACGPIAEAVSGGKRA